MFFSICLSLYSVLTIFQIVCRKEEKSLNLHALKFKIKKKKQKTNILFHVPYLLGSGF